MNEKIFVQKANDSKNSTLTVTTSIPKICVVGTLTYESKNKIKELLFKFKTQFGDKGVEIVSTGKTNGADKYIKKAAIAFDLKYLEFNPAFTEYNMYSACPPSYYGKTYHMSKYNHRNKMIAKYCEKCIVLKLEAEEFNYELKDLVKQFEKLNKKIVILS